MTKPNLKHLRATALAATPGPWTQELFTADQSNDPLPHVYSPPRKNGENPWHLCQLNYDIRDSNRNILDAAHIATFNPQTILALLDVIEKLYGALDKAAELLRVPEGNQFDSWHEDQEEVEETLAKVGEMISFEEGR